MTPVRPVPIRSVSIMSNDAVFERREDGALLIRLKESLGDYPDRLTDRLEHWAAAAPDRIFIARRAGGGAWGAMTYAETLARVESLGAALLARGLSVERPVLILSGNDIEHALLGLACLHVGIPYAPISTAYSLLSRDHARLRSIVDLLTPGLVFAADGERYAAAIRAAMPGDAELVVTEHPPAGRQATYFSTLAATVPDATVAEAAARVGPDSVGKFLFTSGSTGLPKGVINTQRMLCSNQQMLRRAYPVLAEEPPVIVDWLPWNHTFGGNHNVGLVLYNGGTLYIDDGRPIPSGIGETVRNLREIAPTIYFNVPKGFEELVPYLRRDEALRRHFFSRLRMLFYAGAALSAHVWDVIDELAVATTGERIQWMTGLGSTETAPFATSCRPHACGPGMIGLPVPGVAVKLAPVGDKMEVRVKGPNVTPGYWRNPGQTAALFDEENWLRMGDAAIFADPADPQKGLRFDGRISEDFKLVTGSWVSVGPLRALLLRRLAPWVREVVIAGADRHYVAVLAIPAEPHMPQDEAAQAALREALRILAAEAGGSSRRVERLAFLTVPLSIDTGELTDKGSVNQRAVLRHHTALVEALYLDPPPAYVIDLREMVG
jgi:feruloyl-CoA synthase